MLRSELETSLNPDGYYRVVFQEETTLLTNYPTHILQTLIGCAVCSDDIFTLQAQTIQGQIRISPYPVCEVGYPCLTPGGT